MHLIDEGVTKLLVSLTMNVSHSETVARNRSKVKNTTFTRLTLEDMRKTFETIRTPREVTVITGAYSVLQVIYINY